MLRQAQHDNFQYLLLRHTRKLLRELTIDTVNDHVGWQAFLPPLVLRRIRPEHVHSAMANFTTTPQP